MEPGQNEFCMRVLGLRSPVVQVGVLVYFARMLDKIRAHAKGELPPDYQANLGPGFDERCVAFLRVNYKRLVEPVKQGGARADMLPWCFSMGLHPGGAEPSVSYELMRK